MEPTAVIYEGTPAELIATERLTIVGADGESLVAEAERLAAAGWNRLELCGGVDVRAAAAVRTALSGRVRVGLNRYGFESLDLAAAYKSDFAAGVVRPAAFLVPVESGATPRDTDEVWLRSVGSPEDAASVAAEVAAGGAGLIELYGGLGTAHAAAAVRSAGGRVPVGFVGYDD